MGEVGKLRGLWILSPKAVNLVTRFQELKRKALFLPAWCSLLSSKGSIVTLALRQLHLCWHLAGIRVHLGVMIVTHSMESALIDLGYT